MRLLIAGDLVPTQSNIDLFNNGDIVALLGNELCELWDTVDVRCFNLEVPIINKAKPIPKCGPNLISPVGTIKGIKKLNPSLITLANNHILDQDKDGLISTRELLNECDIPFVGVGNNLSDANRPYFFVKDGIRIGIYACAENEFSIATNESPGANPFDPLESLDHIQGLKNKCDYVIVLYHGGKEHYRYPSPYLQKASRKMVEKGADLIVCQHSHCVGCYEKYKDSTIIYGQGNFIFNMRDDDFWNTGLLVKVNIKDKFDIEYIPILRTGKGTSLATGEAAEKVLSEFEQRSQEILKEGFVEQRYKDFSLNNIDNYLRKFLGFGKWYSRIERRIFKGYLLSRKSNKEYLLAIQNFIECEAHRELVLAGLKEKREMVKE
jgi:poly-gamma-glutamate synthesis protein (capsule biosynthesis protein)